MGLAEQFELLELIHRDKAETWLAREKSSNRRLLLHIFEENSGLRERLLAMGPSDLIMLVGAEKDGDSYIVVTHDAPVLRKFREWAESRSATVELPAGPVTRESPALPPDPERTVIMPAIVRESQISGEFELMFDRADTPPVRSPFDDEPAVPPSRNAPKPASVSGADWMKEPSRAPGEFAGMFQAPGEPPTKPGRPVSPPHEPPALPGEFTLMFQKPASDPPKRRDTFSEQRSTPFPAGNQAPPKQPSSAPGDFTLAFEKQPAPSEHEQAIPSRPVPKPSERAGGASPNAFPYRSEAPTQSFPKTPSWETSKSVSDGPGEFTKIFSSPFSTPPEGEKIESPPPQPQRPNRTSRFSEPLTQGFEQARYDSAMESRGSGATGIFGNAKPPGGASVEPAKPVGPSEYTRVFQAATPPQTAAPPVAEPPKETKAAKAEAADKRSPVPLVIVLAVLAVVAVALVLYFSLKR